MTKKYVLSCMVIILCLFTHIVHADYFEEEIVGADPETGMLQDIELHAIRFSSSKEVTRYNNTLSFINSIKTEAVKRFEDGSIPLYRRYDIITSLESFTYTMNQYFFYQSRYESTKKNVYKESARNYLEDSK